MRRILIDDIASEDFEDILLQIEVSFDIKFERNELENIYALGELFDHIENKIELEDRADCTNQQAFYMLREAIAQTLEIDKSTIGLQSKLADLMPRNERRVLLRQIEEHLGFKINLLKPSNWVEISLMILTLISFATLFYDSRIGFTGLLISIIGFRVVYYFAKELKVETIADLVKKMTRENYIRSRRYATTFNKNEVKKILTEIFSEYLSVPVSR